MRVALVIFGILVAVIIANGVRIASRVEQHPLDHELALISREARQVADRVNQSLRQLHDAQQGLDSVRRQSAARVDALQAEWTAKQQQQQAGERRLATYQSLLSRQEGALLADGTYISPNIVRMQHEHERLQLAGTEKDLQLLQERLVTERSLQQSYDLRCRKAQEMLDQLQRIEGHLQDQLDRVTILQNAAGESTLGNELETDVRSVQRAVARLEYQLDAFSRTTRGADEIVLPDLQ